MKHFYTKLIKTYIINNLNTLPFTPPFTGYRDRQKTLAYYAFNLIGFACEIKFNEICFMFNINATPRCVLCCFTVLFTFQFAHIHTQQACTHSYIHTHNQLAINLRVVHK